MQKLLRNNGGAPGHPLGLAGDGPSAATPLLEVLWRRRWSMILCVFACVLIAGVYLAFSTKVYSATAKVYLEQHGPQALDDGHAFAPQSDSYLQTQADAFQSTQVLNRALEAARWREMATFAKVSGDPVAALRRSGALQVEVVKKSDVIAVSMQSPYPEEAASFANSVVDAYVTELAQQRRATGVEIIKVLEFQQEELQKKRDSCLQAMLKFKRENGVSSLGMDKGNTALDRTASLNASLTSAEIAVMELRAQWDATKAALATPASVAAFVQGQQMKEKDSGDREYDELRSQLVQHELALSTCLAVQGDSNKTVLALQSVIASVKQRIADKERALAEAQLAGVSAQLAAAEAKERQLHAAVQAQQGRAIELSPGAAEYARIEADLMQVQKQSEALETQMNRTRINSMGAAPLNVQVLEPARAETKPVKPNKTLTLAAAMLVGWVLGMGIAMLREWQDARIRRPEEIGALLNLPVVARIPRINARLSPVARGQVVHLDARSPVAEAYRSVRTSLHLGEAREARTILVVSPTAGDGKSTTASNLAIAFAQGGHRTLLIDCDLREPVQHLIFETDCASGVSSVVANDEKLRDAIRPTLVASLYLLPCGPIPANPSELLASRRFAQLMQSLAGSFDRIVVDSPALMTATDAHVLAASADATLLVLRMDQSMRKAGVLALEGLEKVGANVLGAIANDVSCEGGRRSYTASWQYAASAKRLLAHANRGLVNGEAHAAMTSARHAANDDLMIDEPNWSADAR